MRIFTLTVLSVILIAGSSFGITGLGFGVRGGYITGLNMGPVENWAGGLNFNASLEDKMTMIGGHIKVGTLPIIDFEIAAEYSWKNMDLGEGYKLKFSDFSLLATAIYNLKLVPTPMITPYFGAGIGTHKLVYSLDEPSGAIIPFPIDNVTKLGYHGILGAKVHPPLFPLEFFAQYRYTYINTTDKATKFSTILAGATFNLP